ncbi:MAG: cisplatin damage response ATP-dependent DNA ligase [Beijerinckiaceae bacterium]|jgi:DNA ligase 1|nr:cisplatin damage response ATP-dependent DNA ligase [Beijerinckiaceae bacterium]
MKAFAQLLERLAFEPARNGKLRHLQDYLKAVPDPDRGYGVAAITGGLDFTNAKAGLIRTLISERTDPVLFALSYDFVGDLSETAALLWPEPDMQQPPADLKLQDVITILSQTGKAALPQALASLLDQLDESGRWALLKLITGGLRIGVSARLARTAIANNAQCDVNDIEDMWPALEPPYTSLLAWMDGTGPRPAHRSNLVFRPAMLAHALDEKELDSLNPADFSAEWKWDGIRIQASAGTTQDHSREARLYSRTGENIGQAFPDIGEILALPALGDFTLDGELLIMRAGKIDSFGTLQKRLNRKKVSPKLIRDFPAHIRAYDLLSHNGEDLRALPFVERRALLESFIGAIAHPQIDLSPRLPFDSWEALTAARADPAAFGGGTNAAAVEGVMIKRNDAPYVPGRPKGLWYKWKRDPFLIDAVLMYAQRGHGKRSGTYSDFTFGVWKAGAAGDELVPVGKAYFGFTDAELKQINTFIRDNTRNTYGPVREVESGKDKGLVLEIAFEGLNRSPRHKSGVAMRFPRVSRIRWDKPAGEADRIEGLEALLG